ncbi:MAG: LuxR C-terminal-related transcriptional regulator [Gammaproteobacteria bacterium]
MFIQENAADSFKDFHCRFLPAIFVVSASSSWLDDLIPKLNLLPELRIESFCCDDRIALLRRLEQSVPILVLLDCALYHVLGERILSEIRLRCAESRLVLVFEMQCEFSEAEMIVNDIRGCLPRDQTQEFYGKAIPRIMDGELWLPHALMSRIFHAMRKHLVLERRLASRKRLLVDPLRSSLTPRESEIGDLVLEGLTNKEIARKLKISEDTVKKHLKQIFKKLAIKRRAQIYSSRTISTETDC